MRTLVITGGTQGIGRGLALHYLSTGQQVVAVGSDPAKGRALAGEARAMGAADRLHFHRADLSSVAATTAAADLLRGRHPTIDALVLGAFRYQPRRSETAEGLERTFALYVVSRYLLVDRLLPALDRAPRPVVVNLCGTGGIRAGRLHWDDLQLRAGYRAATAAMQGARAADLTGTAFAVEHPDSPVRYVLYNPLFVDTGLAEPLRPPTRTIVRALARVFATPVSRAIRPIVALVDDPPTERLTAFRKRTRVPIDGPAFDPADATRLSTALRHLIATAAGR